MSAGAIDCQKRIHILLAQKIFVVNFNAHVVVVRRQNFSLARHLFGRVNFRYLIDAVAREICSVCHHDALLHAVVHLLHVRATAAVLLHRD